MEAPVSADSMAANEVGWAIAALDAAALLRAFLSVVVRGPV